MSGNLGYKAVVVRPRLCLEWTLPSGDEEFEPRAKGKKRRRKNRGDDEESVDSEADRRNTVSARINYDVVNILAAQQIEEDADLMPNSPGPVAMPGKHNAVP